MAVLPPVVARSTKTFLSWSSGKDSAMALHRLRREDGGGVDCLLTAVNEHFGRVSIHGVRRGLLRAQAAATGLPLREVTLPQTVSNAAYENCMAEMMAQLKLEGYDRAAFGDIFLEDLRAYREQQLATAGFVAVFPLWKEDTAALANGFLRDGFKAVVVCVEAGRLDASFAGREVDADFLRDLPAGVDPCGENGEFHTFCYDGPVFSSPVRFEKGETVYREYPLSANEMSGSWYCDLLPVE